MGPLPSLRHQHPQEGEKDVVFLEGISEPFLEAGVFKGGASIS